MGKNFKQWKDVEHVERTNDLTVTIKHQTYKTIYEYESPQDCLKGFLSLKKEFDESWKFKGPEKYRNGGGL